MTEGDSNPEHGLTSAKVATASHAVSASSGTHPAQAARRRSKLSAGAGAWIAAAAEARGGRWAGSWNGSQQNALRPAARDRGGGEASLQREVQTGNASEAPTSPARPPPHRSWGAATGHGGVRWEWWRRACASRKTAKGLRDGNVDSQASRRGDGAQWSDPDRECPPRLCTCCCPLGPGRRTKGAASQLAEESQPAAAAVAAAAAKAGRDAAI
jgi:hypothetical protein